MDKRDTVSRPLQHLSDILLGKLYWYQLTFSLLFASDAHQQLRKAIDITRRWYLLVEENTSGHVTSIWHPFDVEDWILLSYWRWIDNKCPLGEAHESSHPRITTTVLVLAYWVSWIFEYWSVKMYFRETGQWGKKKKKTLIESRVGSRHKPYFYWHTGPPNMISVISSVFCLTFGLVPFIQGSMQRVTRMAAPPDATHPQ